MHPRLVQSIALALSAFLLFASSRFTPAIDAGRATLNMMGDADLTRRLPPEYAFFVQAFGAFRGLLTNLLFIRAEKLKEEGKYYDARELASLITKLQPRFVGVWEFLSWNMAWNISVTTYTPEERWYWVYQGVRLLRDEGLKYNPHSVNLYRQLAWIFVNKMSETVDEHHMSYKRNWAWHMHLVFGPPENPILDAVNDKPLAKIKGGVGSEEDILAQVALHEQERNKAIKKAKEEARGAAQNKVVEIKVDDTNKPRPADSQPAIAFGSFDLLKQAEHDYLTSIADAPASLKELYAKFPATREMVNKLRDIRVRIDDAPLTEDQYDEADGLAVRFFYPYRMLTDPPSMLAGILKRGEKDPRVAHAEALDRILGARAGSPAGLALTRFLQRKVLVQVYKLDPAKMLKLVDVFGPMDWRVVDAHSLYWVNEGLIAGEETISKFTNDKTNTCRLIFFSLRNLVQRNKMIFEPHPDVVRVEEESGLAGGGLTFKMDSSKVARSYLNQAPDLNFILSLHNAYLTYGPQIDPDQNGMGAGETFRAGHVNFLNEHIRLLYFAGWKAESSYFYEYLRTTYGQREQGGFDPQYEKGLDDYVMDSWREQSDTQAQVRMAVGALMLSSYDALASGDMPQFEKQVALALKFYWDYNKDTQRESNAKMRFPPFTDMQADMLRVWIGGYLPPGESSLIRAARLWKYCPLYLQQPIYDDVLELLKKECEAAGFEVARAFPEPEGMEEYRKSHPRRGPDDKETPVETPVQPFK